MTSDRAAASVLVVAAMATPARAEPPSASVRVGAAVGALSEVSWFAPEVDAVGVLPVGKRAFVGAMLGYAIPDDHTYLADGQDVRFVVTAGARVGDALRASAGPGLEWFAFNADPDVEAQHPGVDLVVHRTFWLPTANVELAYAVTSSTTLGLYGLVALRDIRLFDTPTGDHLDARLVLVGAFVQLRLR